MDRWEDGSCTAVVKPYLELACREVGHRTGLDLEEDFGGEGNSSDGTAVLDTF